MQAEIDWYRQQLDDERDRSATREAWWQAREASERQRAHDAIDQLRAFRDGVQPITRPLDPVTTPGPTAGEQMLERMAADTEFMHAGEMR